MSFNTPIVLSGPLREPINLLEEQIVDGHKSLHDEGIADDLGFVGGPIEGPTHFSQFVPLLAQLWGQPWYETGCLSAHFQNVCVQGDQVRAFAEFAPGADQARVWAEKADGTPVLTGTASPGPKHPPTELETYIERLRPPGELVILSDLHVGMRGAETEPVRREEPLLHGDGPLSRSR